MRLYTDPRGEAYEQAIDLAIRTSECFVLKEHVGGWAGIMRSGGYNDVVEALRPYLVKTIELQDAGMDEIIQMQRAYRSDAFYTAGTYHMYKCCEESGLVLKRAANRLADWIYPHLPEDLCFLKEGDGDYLFSIVHEKMYGMDVTETEALELMDRVTGLFLELERHQDLEYLLDDAIKHRTDKLYISGHRLTELPERIKELTELRELEVFEQDLYRLPEGLFELSKLERLAIMTADLEGIPASIAKLKSLKELRIYCGSSDRPAPGWKVKPKEEISLNRIPPEIGELQMLKELTIQYSAIHKLPPELEKLKRLRVLNVGSCKIKRKPAFLKRMKQLKHVSVSEGLY
ncbi:leucine-rich repeat domain-containing protein [Paenibacillus soyae]|uniref:Leucine-rich repeat domain-containing protein n=1 Tax=Paenibacillus soyae TaxID=2969249 RepID=A0A9X2MQQ7_9BACL|nr:leucine-rich repeat domain-containing protein [Paenibacillus soyae]MCR2804655.1 leucine-rich repeat domain-containing protein [Paenibacillus soyae]